MNGLTALRGLELLDLEPGATLGVTGGAGLLASYVIPLAKLRGLRVLADAGPADAELVRGFGADVVLPRGDDLPEAMRAAAPGGVDAVFDTAVLGRGIFAAIRTGGALAFVRTLGRRRRRERHRDPPGARPGGARADGLAARAERPRGPRRARAARRRHVPARAEPPTRTGRWRPAACAAAPSSSSTEGTDGRSRQELMRGGRRRRPIVVGENVGRPACHSDTRIVLVEEGIQGIRNRVRPMTVR